MSAGEGLRKRQHSFFVQVPRETIRDANLSWKARGLLAFLLDMPDGWDVRSEWLAEQGPDGRDAIQAGLKELRVHGYLRLERRRLRDGRLVMGTAISESPVPGWIEQSAEANGKAVMVIQQPDGSFLVRRKDGTLAKDGFEDVAVDGPPPPEPGGGGPGGSEAPESGQLPLASPTETGFPGPGEPSATETGFAGSGFPDSGLADSGKPRALRKTETGDREDQNPSSPATAGEAASQRVIEDAFDEFWRIYPRKVGKSDAERMFRRAAAKVGIKPILDGARRFAADPNLPPRAEAQFIAHPATWLHRGSWDDEPLPPRIDRRREQPAAYDDEASWGRPGHAPAPQPPAEDLDAIFGQRSSGT